MQIVRFLLIPALLAAAIPALHAEDKPTTPSVAVAPAADPAVAEALKFLALMEGKNTETKTLSAEFDQVRIDSIMDEEVKSTGKFWYKSPSSFYAEYDSATPEKVWSNEKRVVSFIPSMRQVDVVQMETGDDAPVTQVLLGFGIKVEKIGKLFDVKRLPTDEEGVASIEFLSKDLDKTLNFHRIVVVFDEKLLEPRRLEMEDNTGSRTITLKKVRINPDIKASVFEVPKFPKNVEINGEEYL